MPTRPGQSSTMGARDALAAFVTESPLDLSMLDREGRFIAVSDSDLAASGASREQLIGAKVVDLYGEAARTLSEVLASSTIEQAVTLSPVRVVNPSGKAQWIQTSCSPWRDETGAVGGIICANHNITAEQQALLELGRTEALLNAIVESIPSMLAVQDHKTGDYVRINRASEAFVGRPREEILGKGLMNLVGEEASKRHWERVEEADVIQAMICVEELTPDGAGRLRTLRTRRQIIEDREGAKHVLTVAEDITDEKQYAAALQAALSDAKAANQAKSDFLATMSHEIRTPLNGVLGMAQVMALDALTQEQRTRLDVIRSSGQTLLTILNDILDLSKIEAGKLELEAVDFDLVRVIAEASEAFGAIAEAKGLALALETEAASGVYRGDPTRIRQLVANLVSNALKFTAAGGVQVHATRLGREVHILVSDTGAGITEEIVGQLFEKFVQADSSTTRQFGGTGLGLAICRELVSLMGGTISVTSRVGEGSTFAVALPLLRLHDVSPVSLAEQTKTQSATQAPESVLRVLVVEDNQVNQIVLKALLLQIGVEPMIVENGVDAVNAWAANHWDLILMDIQMPLMDGPTATRIIRERECAEGLRRTPIIALTANAMSHQVKEYAAAGMDAFVAKPIEVDRLFAAIEAMRDLEDIDLAAAENG
jgi:PAS domain S-box-containing protein